MQALQGYGELQGRHCYWQPQLITKTVLTKVPSLLSKGVLPRRLEERTITTWQIAQDQCKEQLDQTSTEPFRDEL